MIPVLERFPGEGKDYPLEYSGLENSRDCIVHGATKSRIRLSDFHFHYYAPDTANTSRKYKIITYRQFPFHSSFLVSDLILMSQARILTVNTVLSKNSFLWKSYQSTNAFCAYIAFHRKGNKEHMMELQNSTYSAAWVCRKMTFIVYTALASFPSSHLLTRERNNSKYTPRLKCSPIYLEMMKVRLRKTNAIR